MRYYFFITAFGCCLALSLVPALAQGLPAAAPSAATFFYALNDIPLAPGARELPDEGISFDKPEGRIMGVTAVSEAGTPEQIRSFYNQALPPLGWAVQPDGSFVRETERLRLNVEAHEGVSVIRLQVEPR